MDPHTAAVLLLDLPKAALAGIDLLSFTTTPQFSGVKALPPGAHFIFTAPHATLAVRHGAWFFVPSSPVPAPYLKVKKWDASTETLVPELDPAALLRHRANLGAIWRSGMTPYRQHARDSSNEADNDWTRLSSRITPAYLTQVLGPAESHWHMSSYSDVATTSSSSSFDADAPLRLIPLDLKRTWPPGATGRERTQAALDLSWYLDDVASRHGDVLAELQFVFLVALTLGNPAAIEQWRTLLRLILGCRAAVATQPGFFVEALELLGAQLSRLSEDDDDDDDDDADTDSAANEKKVPKLEDQSEAQLLAYDLPIRGHKPSQTTSEPQVTRSSDSSSLASLFLDTDSPIETSLQSQLLSFARSLPSSPAVTPVRRALSRLEGMPFAQWGWELDTHSTPRSRSTGTAAVGRDMLYTDNNDDDGDDDTDEDEDDAPAVVRLDQAQLDMLGISGTAEPTRSVTEDAQREHVRSAVADLRQGGTARVVVSGSESESDSEAEEEHDIEEEEWNGEEHDVEELDARY
ncbi:hypothetical protein ANO11243_060050 [Dothideomycetidae sp. 11243]|nr:hypothetical protein ANO11243_060050 [fungal sp. No.11243]